MSMLMFILVSMFILLLVFLSVLVMMLVKLVIVMFMICSPPRSSDISENSESS